MYFVGYFLQAIAGLLDILLTLIMFVVIARAILSWVSPDPYNPVVRFISQVSEPVLYPVRRWVPHFQGVDLSPIVVLLAVYFMQTFVVNSLSRYAAGLVHG